MIEQIVKTKEGKVKILSGNGYIKSNKLLCSIKDTGNGFIAKFPSWTCSIQDNYICMNYSEADYLVKGLTQLMKDWKNKNECSDSGC